MGVKTMKENINKNPLKFKLLKIAIAVVIISSFVSIFARAPESNSFFTSNGFSKYEVDQNNYLNRIE